MKTSLLFGFLIGCLPKIESKPDYKIEYLHGQLSNEYDELEKAVERELGKHDSWIEDVLAQGNNHAQNDGKLRFVKDPQENNERNLLGSSLNVVASYDPQTNTIHLPIRQEHGLKIPPPLLDSIDHELFHYVFDEIIGSEKYQGPSKEEIRSYLEKRRKEPEFANMPKAISLAENLKREERTIVLHQSNYTVGKAIYEEIKKKKWDKACLAAISYEERIFIETAEERMSKRLEEYQDALNSAITDFNTLQDEIQKQEISLQGLLNHQEKINALEEKVQALSDYIPVGNNFYSDAKKIAGIAEKIGYGPHQNTKEAREKEEGNELKECLKDDLNCQALEDLKLKFLELAREKNISVHSLNYNEINRARDSYNFLVNSKEIFEIGIEKIQEMFYDDDEFLARMVDSACSIYFGPMTDLQYQLNENDTAFISSMKMNERPLFGKCVEKYEAARSMQNLGVSNKRVKEELEYATEITWQGKMYNWAETKI